MNGAEILTMFGYGGRQRPGALQPGLNGGISSHNCLNSTLCSILLSHSGLSSWELGYAPCFFCLCLGVVRFPLACDSTRSV